MTNYAVGGFVGSALAAAACHLWGWRAAFWVPALALGVVGILFWYFQTNKPEDVGLPSIEKYHHEPLTAVIPEAPPSQNTRQVIGEVLRSPMVWLLAAVYFFLKPTRYLLLFWSPTYLHERLGTNTFDSGFLGGLFDLAGPFSVIAGGYVSDRVFGSRRMPICVIALLASAVLMLLLDGLPHNRYLYGGALFAIGFLLFIPDSLVSGTAAIDFGTKQGASTAAGIINGSGSIGAILGGTLPGWMEGMVGEGNYIWRYIFISLAVTLVLAALLMIPNWNKLPATVPSSGRQGGNSK
jgi:OPA family sugar phosphate sensor protein UhpC-like MFS transporter